MFLINSRYPHFTATSKSFRREVLHSQRHTFSRSYGVKLPSSLTRFHSITLGYSPHLPESVYGTSSTYNLQSFSRKHGFCEVHPAFQGWNPITPRAYRVFYPSTPCTLGPRTTCRLRIAYSVPLKINANTGNGILTVYPSTTPLGLALGLD